MCQIKIYRYKHNKLTLVSQTHIELSDYECDELIKILKIANYNDNCGDLYHVEIHNNGKRQLFKFLDIGLSKIKKLIQTIINDISSN